MNLLTFTVVQLAKSFSGNYRVVFVLLMDLPGATY